jgi:flagellar hook-associated protein 2
MTTSTASSISSAPPLAINGLVSGINTQAVIQALLQSYQIPINNLKSEQSSLNSSASDYQTLNSDMQALLTAADALNMSNGWDLMAATSSSSTVASATSAPGAVAGSLSFEVTQLAQANMELSQGSVSSTGTVVTNAPSLLVATGGEALGFASLSASGSLALGSHTIQVTQASTAASITGTSALSSSTTITTGSNDTVNLSVNGTAYTLTLAAGTYTPSQLVAAFNAAASAAGAAVSASLSSSGSIELATTEQGSAASLSVTGGDGLSSLGLASGQSGTGTDAIVSVDGTATTLSALNPGGVVTLTAPTGSINATLASAPAANGSLVSAGTAQAALVSTGNGSLSSIVSAINASGLGVSAQAVQESSGAYVLQVGATSTGLTGAVSLDPSVFAGGPLVGMTTITQAQDALISVGGTGGYQVSSSTDTFTGLMAGTAITVNAVGQATVTVSPDAAGEAAKVQSLVNAANQTLSDIQKYAGYDASTKTAGPLMGSAVLTMLQQNILSIFARAAGTSGLGNSQAMGITLNKDGSLSFDKATFEAAFNANPTGVANLFTQGGTFNASSPSYVDQVSFVYAGTSTVPGTYAVQVSHSATQATDTGSTLSSGTVSSAENLTITEGSLSATYATSSGESLTAIASGLNAAFAAQGMTLSASVVNSGTQLQITSNAYGSSASFSVSSSNTASGTTGLGGATANTPVSFSGTDVVGTINGVAGIGTGQVLAAPSSDPTLQGLSVLVSAQGISSATNLGSITYEPGLAQQLATIADAATNPTNGSLTTEIQSLQDQASGLNSQIANYQQLESSQQTLLQNEFAKMESTLGKLKSESSQLASSLAGLPGF